MTAGVEIERHGFTSTHVLERCRIVQPDEPRLVVQFHDELPDELASDDSIHVASGADGNSGMLQMFHAAVLSPESS